MPPDREEALRRLGFFGPFMAAYHDADDGARLRFVRACQRYTAGELAETDFVAVVERTLGVKVPVNRA